MAQRHINYGAFPDDLNADAIRAAFQKSEDNFTELFTGAATAGVSRIIAGPGITLQGSSTGTGNVTVAATFSSVTLNTSRAPDGAQNIILSGGNSATTRDATPISININEDGFTVNNFVSRDTISVGDKLALSLDSNNNIVLGGPNSNISGQFITGVISQPYQDPSAGPIVPGQVQFSARFGNGEYYITGSQAFTVNTVSNIFSAQNFNTSNLATIVTANIGSAVIYSQSDSNTGNTSTGALQVLGGLSVQKSISIGNAVTGSDHTIYGNVRFPNGNLSVLTDTPATNLGTGAFIIANGGGSVRGNWYVGNSLTVTDEVIINSANTSSALVVTGGSNIGGNLEIGGYANIAANARVGTDLDVIGNASVMGNLLVSADSNIVGNLAVNDVNASNNILSLNSLQVGANGALLFVNQDYANINSNSTIIISEDVRITSSNSTAFSGNITIGGGNVELATDTILFANGEVNSTSATSGSIVVNGGVGLSGNINVGGNAVVANNVSLTQGNLLISNGNLTVSNANSNISARGSNTHIQYNNTGNLAGNANFTWDNTNANLTANGNIRASTALLSANVQASYPIDGAIQYANSAASPVTGLAVLRATSIFRYVASNSTLLVPNATVSTSIAVGNSFTASNTSVTISQPTTVSNNLTITGNLSTGASSVVTFAGPTLNANAANIQFRSLGVGTPASGVVGEIRATNDITAFYVSDRQYKENIRPIDNALAKAAAISGYFFDWTDEHIANRGGEDGYFVNKHDIGVIAQEVQPHVPEVVKTKPDGSLAVDYPKLVALCLAALAEVKQELDKLKGK